MKTPVPALALLLLATCSLAPLQPPLPEPLPGAGPALPLGWSSLPERRDSCELAAGVRLTRIVRGRPRRGIAQLAACGSAPVQALSFTGGGHESPGPRPGGPYAVHVLDIDPARYRGRLLPRLAQDRIVGKETPSALARRAGALAAVNGGYFVTGQAGERDGIAGDPAGALVIDGEPVSEAVRGRSALWWQAGQPGSAAFGPVASEIAAVAGDGRRLQLDGINRLPGRIRMCGGLGDRQPIPGALLRLPNLAWLQRPMDQPRHDQTCIDDDEIVAFEPVWGAPAPAGEGAELAVDADGVAQPLRARGGAIPARGFVLAATGARVAELAGLPGARLWLSKSLHDDGGRALPLLPQQSLVSAGPLLLRDGAVVNREREEGFVDPANPPRQLYYRHYAHYGQPRTLAARTADGHLLLVVVDGRRDDWSVGVSFEEASRLLLALGAVDGMNLDGGGSSTLVVRGEVVNVVSDPAERPVSDAILLVP